MTLRNLLREQTAESHQQLDDMVANMHVFDSERTYHAYLAGMYQLYAIYGDAVDHASQLAGLTPSVSSLMDAIASDCGTTKECMDAKYSSTNASSKLLEDAACWAVGYVLEGSAMGARYMVKSAEKLTNRISENGESTSTDLRATDSENSTRYLKTLSADSYDRWPKFVEALNDASPDCDEEAAVAAAKQVFDTARNIFETLATELATTGNA